MYKTQGKQGLFDEEFTEEKLVKIGYPLKKISEAIDFEMFCNTLENKFLKSANDFKKSRKSA